MTEGQQLAPGTYMGRDGQQYKVLSDGTTYRMCYRELRKRDKDGNMQVWRRGPTLVRVGHTRRKL